MLALQHRPVEVVRHHGLESNVASSYFAPQLETDGVCVPSFDGVDLAATSKSHITRRLAFENRDSEQRNLGQQPGVRSEQYIRHSDVSYRMHASGNDAKAQFREPVIVPPSCPSAVLWDGGATGPSVLLRHGSGCSFTVVPTLMKSLVSTSNELSSQTAWGNIVLESSPATQKRSSVHDDSQFVVQELSSTPHNPYHSYCRIVVERCSSHMRGDASRLIPQHIYGSAIMELASRMCSADAPLGSLSVCIVLVHSPGPSMPVEISLCSISSSFQVSLSPIKAMAVLDSGVLLSPLSASQTPTPTLGWLTIDRRRRLIPVLPGDPMLDQFAVVGVFVSGVCSLQSPIVSAACTWFNSCCKVNRSLIPSDGSFLLLHCTSSSNHSQPVHSLYEAHPNFAKQPFSMRCSEFISFHGSAVTLRPQLIAPECPHPFLLAMEQFGQDSSAVSSEFFSGINEIHALNLPSFADENKAPDRNLVSPLPEPAFPPQPSVYPQFQSVSSSLDNPSVVFQKRSFSVPSQNVDVTASLASNSLGLVQTIIQQQNTISKLQFEKDQLLIRIQQLESLVSEPKVTHAHSPTFRSPQKGAVQCTSPPIPIHLSQDTRNEAIVSNVHSREAVSAGTTAFAVSGLSNLSFAASADTLNGACKPISETRMTSMSSSRSSSSFTSRNSSSEIEPSSAVEHVQTSEFHEKFESGVLSASKSRAIAFAQEFNSSKVLASDRNAPLSSSSNSHVRDPQFSGQSGSPLTPQRLDSNFQMPPHSGNTSDIKNDSVSFTIPKISYVPLSDDDDSAVFTTLTASHACSDDSSISSNS
jgi:hypothetical protein